MDERVERTVDTYEAVADEYQSLHGDRSAVAPIVEAFRERVVTSTEGDDRKPRVIDVGCGPGWEAATFDAAEIDVVGVDITRSFLLDARERAPGGAFLRGDMRTLPVAPGAADGVFALASLLHVPKNEVDDTLGEFARVLSSDGVLTCVVKGTDQQSDDSPYGETDRRHFEFYEPAELRDRIHGVGFEIETLRAEDGWVLAHAQLG